MQEQKNGVGILYKNKNESYRGFFKNNKMDGFGKLKNEMAEFYGYWENGIHIGVGFEIWKDSSNYFGEYKNGKKEGKKE